MSSAPNRRFRGRPTRITDQGDESDGSDPAAQARLFEIAIFSAKFARIDDKIRSRRIRFDKDEKRTKAMKIKKSNKARPIAIPIAIFEAETSEAAVAKADRVGTGQALL